MQSLHVINHLFKRFAIILLISVSCKINAQKTISDVQADSLLQVLHLPTLDTLLVTTEYTPLRNLWYYGIKINREEIENTTLLKLFQKIENLAAKNENYGLEVHAGLWQYYIGRENSNSEYDFNKKLERIVEKATNSGLLWLEISAKYRYAVFLVESQENIENVEKGIWLLRESIDKIHKTGDVSLSGSLKEHYRILTQYYYNMDDMPNSILYSLKALNIEFPEGTKLIPSNDLLFRNMNNNLGVYYREQQQLDSSNFYFKRVYQIPLTKNSSARDSLYKAISGGNLGENLFLQGNYQEALPLLQIDATVNTKGKSWGNASNALILIADIYIEKGEIKKAKQTLDKAIFAAHSSKQIKRLSKLYPILSKYYRTIDQPNIALTYADSTFVALDSLKRKNNQFRGAKVEEAYNRNQIKIAAEKELATKNRNISRRNIGLLFLGLLLFIGFFIFRKSKLKAKQQESRLENKVEQVTAELNDSKKQLNVFIQEAQQKSLSKKIILTDADWREFLQYYKKVHPTFVTSLKTKYPKLTEAEVRFCCLTYLSLSDKEMAAMLGVGRPSIRVTRQRSRAKLQITKEESFEAVFQRL